MKTVKMVLAFKFRPTLLPLALCICLLATSCAGSVSSDENTAWAASSGSLAPEASLTPRVTPDADETLPASDEPRGSQSTIDSPPIPGTPSPGVSSQETVQPGQCNGRFGRLEQTNLTADYLPQPMEVLVYLPPCYDHDLTERFPVLYLIHGQGFDQNQWDRIGADEMANRLITTHQVVPFIIVMPHDALLRDAENSPFRQAFIEILVPWVDKTYRTLNDRAHRAIGGLSRGGAWALYLGLSHHELFSAIGMHSSFFFNGEEFPTQRWLQSIPPEEYPRLFVDIGGEDHLLQANRELEKLLMKNNIPYEWYLYPGRHEETYWSSHVEQYLRWYARAW